MKSSLFLILSFFLITNINAQVPKSGTYIYKFCDLEYNACIGTCKIRLQGNKIWVYAPANRTGIKEGEVLDSGLVFKHSSGKWVIRHPKQNPEVEVFDGTNDPMVWIDFKKKHFWTF